MQDSDITSKDSICSSESSTTGDDLPADEDENDAKPCILTISMWVILQWSTDPFWIYLTGVWQNARTNTVWRVMVCDVYFTFSKIL